MNSDYTIKFVITNNEELVVEKIKAIKLRSKSQTVTKHSDLNL